MADTSLIIGNGNWAVKENSLLGYNIIQGKYVPIEMTVSRNSTGTRVNNAGKIEISPKNLFLYSQTFDNTAVWFPYPSVPPVPTLALIVIPNVLATSAPNGTFTADKLVAAATLSEHVLIGTPLGSVLGTTYTVSLFAKAAELSNIRFLDNAGSGATANFNLATGNVTLDSFATATMVPVGNDWYRCRMTYIPINTGVFNIHIKLANSSLLGGVSFTGNGSDGVYIWGAQLEAGSSATEYFPTTDRFNIPRVDYLNSTTGSLLVEPPRTNEISYSEEFNNASWSIYSTTITANTTLAPDGSFTADKFIPDTNNGAHFIYRTGLASYAYTFSVFAKAGEETTFSMWLRNANFGASFDLSNGTIIANSASIIPKIEPYPNGWYRCSVYDATPGTTAHIYGRTGNGFIGNNVNGFFLWGAQVEIGSNATSYIPTVAGPISRNADVITKTGVSSLIGQTEGTMYAEINITTFDIGAFFTISDGTSVNYIQMYTFNNNKIYCDRVSATQSAPTSLGGTSSALSVGTYKVAFAYQSGNSYLYINGAQVGATSAATFTFGSMGKVNIGTGYSDSTFFNNKIKSAIIFPTRLSPGQLATLTT